jgi:hypothetical protein
MLDWDFLISMAWLSYGVTFLVGVGVGWLLKGWLKK